MNNMTTPLAMVREFAVRMGQLLDQVWMEDKELADGIIVINGYAATFGWDLNEATRRVHKSNMSKLGDDGKPLKNSQGKVLKGPNYQKCNLTDLVETNK